MSQSTSVVPPRLRAQEKVAVCAPAGPVRPDRFRAGLEALGRRYRVVAGEGALARRGYLAGDDDRRAEELEGYLRDPDVRAVIVARGGYGLHRILDRLDPDPLRRDPKIVLGFSDATALLLWALTQAGVRGIHGPMAARFAELGDEDRRWLVRLLEDPTPIGPIPGGFCRIGARGSGRFTGPLLGGNLTLLSHLAGTSFLPDLEGAVLFFEDVGERPYRIDRYLTHLALTGALDGAGAALVGELHRCCETSADEVPEAGDVVDERLRAFGIAGLGGLPFGHGERNLALPIGARCEVDLDGAAASILEGAVS